MQRRGDRKEVPASYAAKGRHFSVLRERHCRCVAFGNHDHRGHRYFLDGRRAILRADHMKTSVFARILGEPLRPVFLDVLDGPQFPLCVVASHQHIPVAFRRPGCLPNLLRLMVRRLIHARIIIAQFFHQSFGGWLVHLLFGLLVQIDMHRSALRAYRAHIHYGPVLARVYVAGHTAGLSRSGAAL